MPFFEVLRKCHLVTLSKICLWLRPCAYLCGQKWINRIFSKLARAISKIVFILGSYNFLASLECIRSYTWSKGQSDPDPDLSSVLRSIEQEFVTFLRQSLFQLKSSLEFQKCSSITITIFSHRSSEQFWKQNTTISCCLFFFFTCEGNLLMEM